MENFALIEPKAVVFDHATSLDISVPEIGVKKLVIVSWLPHIVEKLREAFNATRAKNWLYKNNPIYSTKEVTIGHIRPGAPAAAIYIEQLIAAGAEKIITIGYAGSLVEDISIGDVVVPTCFVSTEGTSQHYCRSTESIVPTDHLLEEIRQLPQSKSFKYGKCWSTDALFRETVEDIKTFAQQGALCVDLETSACAAVCNYRKIETCNFLLISDLVHGSTWVKGFADKRLRHSTDEVVQIMLDVESKHLGR